MIIRHFSLILVVTSILSSCGIEPSVKCVDEGVSLLQQGSFTETPSQAYCEIVNALLVAVSNNTCGPSATYQYIANNSEHIINKSPLAGLPDIDKKNEAMRLSKAAKAIVGHCKLN